jgi:hypothetical protein
MMKVGVLLSKMAGKNRSSPEAEAHEIGTHAKKTKRSLAQYEQSMCKGVDEQSRQSTISHDRVLPKFLTRKLTCRTNSQIAFMDTIKQMDSRIALTVLWTTEQPGLAVQSRSNGQASENDDTSKAILLRPHLIWTQGSTPTPSLR